MIILPSLEIVPAKYNTSTNTLLSQIPIDGTGDFTVSRTTSPVTGQSTRVNALGQIEQVADNVPRLDYPLGGAVNGCPALLVEPAATNGIRNNSMVGAVAGTPGTLPTNWTVAESTPGIISREIIGIGTENGVNYLDLRIFGTGAAAGAVFISFDSSTQITASSGQVWASSLYGKIISGTPSSLLLNNRWGLSTGVFVSSSTQSISLTSNLSRLSFASTAPATTERVQPRLEIVIQNGVAYDFTIRIGYPQLELGSVATSVIPTTTAAVTRSADVISRTSASALIGQSEGTIYAEVDIRNLTDGRILTLFNSATRYILLSKATNRLGGAIIDTTSSPITLVNLQTASGSLTAGTYKLALAYASGDFAFYVNGTQVATSATGGVIGGYTILRLGNFDTSLFFNDRIRAAALYPNRLTDTQLALLTSPYTSYSSMASALSYTLG